MTGGRGQKSENFADVVFGSPLIEDGPYRRRESASVGSLGDNDDV